MSDANRWWDTDRENDAVATKPELWRPIAEKVGGFDLDPAAGCEPTPIADTRYTEADDGLAQPWFGTVWLNPPFSEKVVWYRRLVDHVERNRVERAVAVAPADPSADWFHDWFATADVIGFLNGRDWYLADGSSPSFQTMLGVWSPTPALESWLSSMGTLVRPEHDTQQARLCEVRQR